MKNILIIGVARTGKTTLSKMVKQKYNEYNLIHSDSIIWGIIRGEGKEEYYTKNIDKRKEYVHSETMQNILIETFKSLIKADNEKYGIIFETGQLEPKYLSELLKNESVYCICLGHGDLDEHQIKELCRKHDTETDWTSKMNDEQLEINCKKWTGKNKILKDQCKKYNIEYFDTSNNRREVLENILNKIVKENG